MTDTSRERVPGEGLVPLRGPHYSPAADGPLVGVLALQGDVLEHLSMLGEAGARAVPVKRPEQLDDVDGLLIPGGESTTIGKLAAMYGLIDPLRERIEAGLPVFGTCAGAILLARTALSADGAPSEQPLLGCMDTVVRRNAFGRQVASFEADIDVAGVAGGPMHAVFIRAPWFESLGPDVQALATVGVPAGHETAPGGAGASARVVVARQGSRLASAFHPELAGDNRLHRLFVEIVLKES